MALSDDQLPPGADWLAKRLEGMERAITELRAARGSEATSFRGGAFRLLDTNLAARFAAGQVGVDGSILGLTSLYGLFVFADDVSIVVMTRQGTKGLAFPSVPVPFHTPTQIDVTGAAFATLWEVDMHIPAHEVLVVQGAIITPAGTTGEIRLTEGFTDQSTDALAIPSNTNGYYSFRWKHPGPSGLYDQDPHSTSAVFFGIQARRTGGAGNVTVYPPQRAIMSSTFLFGSAATNGDPQLL